MSNILFKIVSLVFLSSFVVISNNNHLSAATHAVNTSSLDDSCNYVILFDSPAYKSFIAIKDRMVFLEKSLINQKKWSYLTGPKLTKIIPVRQQLNMLHLRPVIDAANGFVVLKVQSERGVNNSEKSMIMPRLSIPHTFYVAGGDDFDMPKNFIKLQSLSNFFEYAMHLFGAKPLLKQETHENLEYIELDLATEVTLKIKDNQIWVADIPFHPPIVHTGAAEGVFEYLVTLPSLPSAPTIYASNPKCNKNIILTKLVI